MRILSAILLLTFLAASANATPIVKNGEVWNGTKQLTKSDGKVDKLWISPSQKFAAYTVVVDYIEEYGDFEGEPPKSPTHIVVVRDISKDKVLKEIDTDDRFLTVEGWTDSDILVVFGGSSLEVTGQYIYLPSENKLTKFKMNQYEEFSEYYKRVVRKSAQPAAAPDAAPQHR